MKTYMIHVKVEDQLHWCTIAAQDEDIARRYFKTQYPNLRIHTIRETIVSPMKEVE